MNGTKKRKEKVGEKSERDRERESKLTAWVKLGTFLSLPCVNTGSFSSTDQPKTITLLKLDKVYLNQFYIETDGARCMGINLHQWFAATLNIGRGEKS